MILQAAFRRARHVFLMARSKTPSEPPPGTFGPAVAPLSYQPFFTEQRLLHFYKTGWRPAFGWGGLLVFLALGFNLALGGKVPGAEAILTILSPVFLGMITRSFEKYKGVAG